MSATRDVLFVMRDQLWREFVPVRGAARVPARNPGLPGRHRSARGVGTGVW